MNFNKNFNKIVISVIVIFLFILSLFYFGYRPLRTVYSALKAIHTRIDFEERGRLYQKALSYSPIGSRQIRESFTNRMKKLVKQGVVIPEETLQITIDETEALVRENNKNVPVHLIAGDFYNTLAEIELKSFGKFTAKAIDFLERAEKILARAIQLSPNYQKAYTSLAQTYLYRGSNDKAVELLQMAVDLEPEYPGSYWNLAEGYYFKKDFTKTIENFEKALELGYGAQDPTRMGELARAYFETKDYEKAIEWYKKVIEMVKGNAEAHYTLAIIYRDAGYLEEAREEAEIVKKLKPEARIEIDKFIRMLGY